MDETGHSEDAGAAESGSGADSHDRTLLNGWATSDSPWSNARPAADPDDDVPSWRRPSAEIRPFTQRSFPSAGADSARDHPSGEIRPFVDPPVPPARNGSSTPSWSDGRARYADLMSELPPADSYRPRRPETLQSDDAQRAAVPPHAPASAPPYPYEGDLDDQRRSPIVQQRAQVPQDRPRPAFPAVRPATPGGRRADRGATESARHALEPTPADGLPRVGDKRPVNGRPDARGSYDASSFPRRLPYEPVPPVVSAPPAGTSAGYADSTAFSGFTGRSTLDPGAGSAEQTSMGLPQRVPAQPDVPTVPEPPSVEPTAETPALARIATHLRRGDVLPAQDRQEGFDVNAILAAVREVDGVRDASLRTTPAGAHSLRLDLADGADPAEVSRQVARLLQDRMGLDAAMQGGAVPAKLPPQPPGFTQSPYLATPSPRTPLAPVSGPAAPVVSAPPYLTPASVAAPAASTTPDPILDGPMPPGRAAPDSAAPGPAFPAPAAPASAFPDSAAPVSAFPDSAGSGSAAASSSAVPAAGARGSALPGSALPGSALPGSALPASAPPAPVADPRPASAPPVSAIPARPGRFSAGTTTTGYGSSGTVEARSSGIDSAHPRPLQVGDRPGPRVLIENVQVNTFGTEATVEVRLAVGGHTAAGVATGPAVDSYLLRLCATATAQAVDELLSASDHADAPAKCFVEHAASVPFGAMQVAVVVLLLSCGGWVEPLAGSAVITGDDRHAMVRATLAAVNRRLEALLSG